MPGMFVCTALLQSLTRARISDMRIYTPEQKARRIERQRRYRATAAAKAAHVGHQRRYLSTTVGKRKRAESVRRHLYGLEPADYDALIIAHSGLCAICGKQLDPPYVDHDHTTGAIRGLLCRGCNGALGHFGDTVAGLLIAVDYLKGDQ